MNHEDMHKLCDGRWKSKKKGCGKTFGIGISKHVCGENWICSDCEAGR